MRITDKTLNDVTAEAVRADEKHGSNSMYYRYATDDRRLTILTEEVGEVAREINEKTLDRNRVDYKVNLRSELVQVAAMAVTWIQALDDYKNLCEKCGHEKASFYIRMK